jgi:hypothetical protein
LLVNASVGVDARVASPSAAAADAADGATKAPWAF